MKESPELHNVDLPNEVPVLFPSLRLLPPGLAAVLAPAVPALEIASGVGLLVPLLSLLLGGSNAVPMRPLQWLEREIPNHSPAFYVGVCCVAIVAAIGAKNVASYVAQLFAARLKQRVSIGLRQALFNRLQRAKTDLGAVRNLLKRQSSVVTDRS